MPNDNYQNIKNSPFQGELEFVCFCGKEQKHLITAPILSLKKTACQFAIIDRKMSNPRKYLCKVCNCYLCSICFYDCHSSCTVKDFTEEGINVNNNYKCDCAHENHSTMNEFTFDIELDKYKDISTWSNMFHVQFLNTLFDNDKIFEDLSNYVIRHITQKKYDKKLASIISMFTKIFSNEFKTYYFHPKIISMFEYEHLVNFIVNIKGDKHDEAVLKFRLIYILLFVHLKKDFQAIKNFSVSNYMTSSIFERILHKKYLTEVDSNVFNEHIKEKYFTNKENNLKEIFLNVTSILMHAIKCLDIHTYSHDYKIGLKYISFILKNCFLTYDKIKALIKILSIFHQKYMKDIEEQVDKIKFTLNIFYYLNKIIYLICINYNDEIFHNLMQSKEHGINFIHTNSESGENNNLVKMIIKNSSIFSKIYENYDYFIKEDSNPNLTNSNCHELISRSSKLFNESLKLFSLADNIYYKQLTKISEEDYENFENKLKSIKKEKLNDSNEIFHNLKIKLEKKLEEYFLYLQPGDNIISILTSYIKEFSAKLSNNNLSNNNQDIQNSSSERKCLMFTDTERNNTNNDTYTNKVIHSIKNYFHFLVEEKVGNNLSSFIDSLILSTIDETISKILSFCSDQLVQKDFDWIIAFLSLFLINKNGLRYLLLGKTLNNVALLFPKFPLTVGHFLFQFFKGVSLFAIDLTNHKILLNVTNILISSLKSENSFEHFKYKLMISIKIFNILHRYIDTNEYEKIKFDVLKIIIDSESTFGNCFLNYYNFFSLFPIDYESGNQSNFDDFNLDEFNDKIKNKVNVINYGQEENKQNNKEMLLSINNKINKSNDSVIESKKILFKKSLLEKNKDKRNLIIYQENDVDIEFPRLESKKDGHIDNNNSKIINNVIHNNLQTSDKRQKDKLQDTKLFFYFFSFISKSTYYIYYEEEEKYSIFKQIYSNFIGSNSKEFKKYKKLLSKNILSIKNRGDLLKFLKCLNFIEFIHKNNIENRIFPLTSIEYIEFYNKSNEADNELQKKVESMENIFKVIEIFTQEIKLFNRIVENQSNNTTTHSYIIDLIISVKSITEFFYMEKDVHRTANLYKMVKEFLKIVKNIKQIIDSTSIKTVDQSLSDEMTKMESLSFDIFDTKKIYLILNRQLYEIFNETYLNKKYGLKQFLKEYDVSTELNFTPPSLIETKDYEYFYENTDEETDNCKIKKILNSYTAQFMNIYNTSFIKVIQNKSGNAELIDYRKIITYYFLTYILCDNKYTNPEHIHNILHVVTKLLFYDTEQMQKKLASYLLTEKKEALVCTSGGREFFKILNNKLQESLVLNFITCKNLQMEESYLDIVSITKLYIQFLQLLGEGFNQSFHKTLFYEPCSGSSTMYQEVIKNLLTTFGYVLQNDQNALQGDIPYDKMIILATNFIDFMVEFMEGHQINFGIVTNFLKDIFQFKFQQFLLVRVDLSTKEKIKNFSLRSKIISYLKIRLLHLFICYVQCDAVDEEVVNLMMKDLTPQLLFDEIEINLNQIFNLLKYEGKLDEKFDYFEYSPKKLLKKLIDLYTSNVAFRDSLEMNLCYKLYHLLKLYVEHEQFDFTKFFEGDMKTVIKRNQNFLPIQS